MTCAPARRLIDSEPDGHRLAMCRATWPAEGIEPAEHKSQRPQRGGVPRRPNGWRPAPGPATWIERHRGSHAGLTTAGTVYPRCLSTCPALRAPPVRNRHSAAYSASLRSLRFVHGVVSFPGVWGRGTVIRGFDQIRPSPEA